MKGFQGELGTKLSKNGGGTYGASELVRAVTVREGGF